MMNRIRVLMLSLGCWGIVSCQNENVPPIAPKQMYECHFASNYDSLDVTTALLGRWTWEYKGDFAESKGSYTIYRGLRLEFKSNGILEVYQEANLQSTSQWKIERKDGELYGLVLTPSVSQLYGRILFCGDRVQFNNTYIDGEDNYFRKPR